MSKREYMHEWLKKDAVCYDLPTEEIIQQLANENEKLKAENEELRQVIINDRDVVLVPKKTYDQLEKFKEAIDEIEAVSCGEEQIECDGVYDDSDGMLWIYKKIQALKGK